jgi:hypothetical protein
MAEAPAPSHPPKPPRAVTILICPFHSSRFPCPELGLKRRTTVPISHGLTGPPIEVYPDSKAIEAAAAFVIEQGTNKAKAQLNAARTAIWDHGVPSHGFCPVRLLCSSQALIAYAMQFTSFGWLMRCRTFPRCI